MIYKESNGLSWLEFTLLTDIPSLVHAVFLKGIGGSPPYHSGNMSFEVGDEINNVVRNRNKVAEALQLSHIASLKQKHGKEVKKIEESTLLKFQQEDVTGDALVTSLSDIGLLITHGDCQAALFYDPLHRVIANVHSGWRGSVQNIYAETIDCMRAHYGSKPENLLVCISPSLGPNNAEFIHYRTELPPSFRPFQKREHYFDFWEISKYQLMEKGVLESHIEIAGIDTYTSDDFFSYRRNKITGRNGTLIALK